MYVCLCSVRSASMMHLEVVHCFCVLFQQLLHYVIDLSLNFNANKYEKKIPKLFFGNKLIIKMKKTSYYRMCIHFDYDFAVNPLNTLFGTECHFGIG